MDGIGVFTCARLITCPSCLVRWLGRTDEGLLLEAGGAVTVTELDHGRHDCEAANATYQDAGKGQSGTALNGMATYHGDRDYGWSVAAQGSHD